MDHKSSANGAKDGRNHSGTSGIIWLDGSLQEDRATAAADEPTAKKFFRSKTGAADRSTRQSVIVRPLRLGDDRFFGDPVLNGLYFRCWMIT